MFLFVYCKKDTDTVTQQAVNGMVYNQCTDSGLAGVTIYLKINKDNSELKSYQTVSGSNGNFSFSGVDIHSNSAYSYAINIPSKSGDGATTPEYCGFDGANISFTKDQANTFFKPKVRPSFLFLHSQFINSTISSNQDSIVVKYAQKIFNKNVPILPYYFFSGTYGNFASNLYTMGNYPMGKYNITIDKWRSAIHTTVYDSIYIGWATTKTYTINW